MRRISAALLALPLLAFGVAGCDNDDHHRHYDHDDYRGDRISHEHWDNTNDARRGWDHNRDWDRDHHDWDHDGNRHEDHHGQGITDPDFNRSTWDRR